MRVLCHDLPGEAVHLGEVEKKPRIGHVVKLVS